MHLGFSYIGLIFIAMMIIPNMLWTRLKPVDYEKYAGNESKPLLVLERAGEALVCCLALIFSDFNPTALDAWTAWFIAACAAMLLYEAYWVRYFGSDRTMLAFYRSLLGIPVPGATLPVIAFALLSVYGRNPFLLAAAAVLGVGHIGIHWAHWRKVRGA